MKVLEARATADRKNVDQVLENYNAHIIRKHLIVGVTPTESSASIGNFLRIIYRHSVNLIVCFKTNGISDILDIKVGKSKQFGDKHYTLTRNPSKDLWIDSYTLSHHSKQDIVNFNIHNIKEKNMEDMIKGKRDIQLKYMTALMSTIE